MSNNDYFFDEERNAYIDFATGVIFPIENVTDSETHPSYQVAPTDHYSNSSSSSSQFQPPSAAYYNHDDDVHQSEFYPSPPPPSQVTNNDHNLALRLAAAESGIVPVAPVRRTSRPNSLTPPISSADTPLGRELMNIDLSNQSAADSQPPPGWGWEDWSLARALQSMEIEIAQEMNRGEAFESDERTASSMRRQLFTASTIICIAEIILLAIMMSKGGIAPFSQNPMVGPSPLILVKYGALEMSLCVYKNEWWRMVSAIFVNAGVLHLAANVFIQLRVGGYLEALWGLPQWVCIYFTSGVFGYMLSGIFSPNTVGIGSSGAILGILSAWTVWIIFRWKKVPKIYHRQRNCQLGTVIVAVLITVCLPYTSY